MGTLETWRVLADGNPDDVVLAVDFDATGRAEGRFADLVKGLDGSFTVWESIPQAVSTELGASGDAYLDTWLNEVRASGRTVRGVLGFCIGGTYAGALADRIAAEQARPATLLFDPELSTPLTLYAQYHRVIDSMAAVLTPEEAEAAKEAGRTAHERDAGIAALAADLLNAYQATAKPAFERFELDGERITELTATFTSFVAYLVGAAGLDPLPAWNQSVVLTSSSPTSGLNGARSVGQDITVGRELRLATPHVDLLRDTEVAHTVSELLASA
ncbi:hypothetical protein [Kitasatospora sp. NPDC092286]|uniref:hypothetical protein n=1 Tax=Kitasatospora sp. NPDC092286 TaxID=3364087 RepID=UPI00381F5EC6